MDWSISGREVVWKYKISTKDNLADDPTRHVRVRCLLSPPDGKASSFSVGFLFPFHCQFGRLGRGGACREAVAGWGGLSRAWARLGFWVDTSMDRNQDGRRKCWYLDRDCAAMRRRLR